MIGIFIVFDSFLKIWQRVRPVTLVTLGKGIYDSFFPAEFFKMISFAAYSLFALSTIPTFIMSPFKITALIAMSKFSI